MLHRLIYASHLAPEVDHRELRAIFAASQRNNSARFVSGMRLFNSGIFLPWLEGNRGAISERFARIAADPRPAGIVLLALGATPQRRFADWHMSYLGEGPLNRELFRRFGTGDSFEPLTLSAQSAEAFMLEAGHDSLALTP